MRIVAQSTLADGSPYLHLGYISSTTMITDGNVDRTQAIGGGVLAFAGLLLIASRLRLVTSRHLWTVIIGALCLLFGGGHVHGAVDRTHAIVGGLVAFAGLLLIVSRFRLLTRRHWWMVGIGAACLILGGGLVFSSFAALSSHEAPQYPGEWTYMHQMDLLSEAYLSKQDIHSLSDVPNWKKHCVDGWNRVMRVERDPSGKLSIRSAGPDGKWGTADDLVSVQQPDTATSQPTTQEASAAP